MNYLIFCSFEVGGLPYKMAEILNRHGVKVYFLSIAKDPVGHDSSHFHYGTSREDWNISHQFKDYLISDTKIKSKLVNIKKEYNIINCFATGIKAYMLSDVGINYYYWSFGSDLDQQCFMPAWNNNYPLWKNCLRLPFYFFTHRRNARKSLRNAQSIMIAPYQIKAYNQVCPGKPLFFLPHFFTITDYELLLRKKQEIKQHICAKIGAQQFFFSATRHFWSGERAHLADNKGNNVIIAAFKKYLEISENHNSKLVLIEKGPDVDSSKALSDQLNITEKIVWLKEMKRDELNNYYLGADICFGQFGTPVLTFAALEPLVNGTICISSLSDNDDRIPFYHSRPPIFSSKDPAKIANFMIKILTNPEEYAELSYQSWLWIKNNCSEEKFVDSFKKIFVA